VLVQIIIIPSGIIWSIKLMTTNFKEDVDTLHALSSRSSIYLEEVTCTAERDRFVNAPTKYLFMTLNSKH